MYIHSPETLLHNTDQCKICLAHLWAGQILYRFSSVSVNTFSPGLSFLTSEGVVFVNKLDPITEMLQQIFNPFLPLFT